MKSKLIYALAGALCIGGAYSCRDQQLNQQPNQQLNQQLIAKDIMPGDAVKSQLAKSIIKPEPIKKQQSPKPAQPLIKPSSRKSTLTTGVFPETRYERAVDLSMQSVFGPRAADESITEYIKSKGLDRVTTLAQDLDFHTAKPKKINQPYGEYFNGEPHKVFLLDWKRVGERIDERIIDLCPSITVVSQHSTRLRTSVAKLQDRLPPGSEYLFGSIYALQKIAFDPVYKKKDTFTLLHEFQEGNSLDSLSDCSSRGWLGRDHSFQAREIMSAITELVNSTSLPEDMETIAQGKLGFLREEKYDNLKVRLAENEKKFPDLAKKVAHYILSQRQERRQCSPSFIAQEYFSDHKIFDDAASSVDPLTGLNEYLLVHTESEFITLLKAITVKINYPEINVSRLSRERLNYEHARASRTERLSKPQAHGVRNAWELGNILLSQSENLYKDFAVMDLQPSAPPGESYLNGETMVINGRGGSVGLGRDSATFIHIPVNKETSLEYTIQSLPKENGLVGIMHRESLDPSSAMATLELTQSASGEIFATLYQREVGGNTTRLSEKKFPPCIPGAKLRLKRRKIEAKAATEITTSITPNEAFTEITASIAPNGKDWQDFENKLRVKYDGHIGIECASSAILSQFVIDTESAPPVLMPGCSDTKGSIRILDHVLKVIERDPQNLRVVLPPAERELTYSKENSTSVIESTYHLYHPLLAKPMSVRMYTLKMNSVPEAILESASRKLNELSNETPYGSAPIIPLKKHLYQSMWSIIQRDRQDKLLVYVEAAMTGDFTHLSSEERIYAQNFRSILSRGGVLDIRSKRELTSPGYSDTEIRLVSEVITKPELYLDRLIVAPDFWYGKQLGAAQIVRLNQLIGGK